METKEAPRSESTVQPTVFIVVQSPALTPDKIHFEKTFSKKLVTVLATLQLISAVLAFIFQIALIANNDAHLSAGAGIWCGVFFGISGGLGTLAACKPSSCSIISFMVMSIISACFCIPLLVCSSIGLGTAQSRRNHWSYYGETTNSSVIDQNPEDLIIGLFAVEIFISLTVAVVAITSSAIACRAVCCRRPKASGSPVLYNVNGFQGQQVLMNGFPAGFPFGSPLGSGSNDPPPGYSSVELEATGEEYRRFS